MSGLSTRRFGIGKGEYYYDEHSKFVGQVVSALNGTRWEGIRMSGELSQANMFDTLEEAREWVQMHYALRRLRGQHA